MNVAGPAQFAFLAFTSIFVAVDPVAAVPTFPGMTLGPDRRRRRRMAARASWTCLAVPVVSSPAGTSVFRLFGITLADFRIAGGFILGLIGPDMIRARRSPVKETPQEAGEGAVRDDVGVIPPGIPMLAGPGSISSVTSPATQSPDFIHGVAVVAAIAASAAISFPVTAAADRVSAHMHAAGIGVMTRMMGLFLAAIAVQFILNGLAASGPIRR